MVNYRGSTGYGQKFSDGTMGDQNGSEAKDVLAPGVFGERRTLTASKSLPCRYPSSKSRKIIPESRRGKSVRDRGVGGSNPLAPTNS